MSRRGRRANDTPKLNVKKVFATIIAIIVIIMMVISLKKLLTPKEKQTKDVSSLTTYIPVYENEKWGVIDNKGNTVVGLEYDEMVIVPDSNKDIFICIYDVDYNNESYKTKVLDGKGKEIFTEYEKIEAIENTDDSIVWYEENVLKYQKDGKYGLIDFDGKEIVAPIYDNIYAMPGVEKSIIIEINGKKGLVNAVTEEIIIEPEYKEITSLSETYENGYIVKNENNKCGIIAPDKKKILEEKYDDIRKVSGNNYYVVIENGKVEVIDSSSNVILNKGYDSIEEIAIDNFVIIKDSKYGVIDKNGQTVIPAEYENIQFTFSDYFIAQKNGKYGIINKEGVVQVNFDYDKITYIKTADFFEAEKKIYTTDIIDRTFNTVLSGVIISELNIEDGYLRVRSGTDYKYYNFKFEEKTNKEILTRNTLFLIKENGKYGYENKNGERIVDPIYDDAKEQNQFGYCAVNKGGLWGALKSDGTVIVEPSRNLEDYLYIDFISEWNRYNDLSINVYTK